MDEMIFMMYAIFIACTVLFIVPIVFVWNEVYQDGVFGRIGLLGISFSAFLFAARILSYGYTRLWPETEIMVISFAIFLCWHLFRFHARVITSRRAEQGKVERRHNRPYHRA